MGPSGDALQYEHSVADIANKVRESRCILFLGAGAHYPPPEASKYRYPETDRPPLGGTLSQTLAKECRFAERFRKDSDTNLQRVSLCYEVAFSRNELVDRIRREVVEGRKPSPALRALARLDFPLVITTNYDCLFEEALRAAGKSPHPIIYSPDERIPTPEPSDFSAKNPAILKIHGSIETPESIVVTDEDYIQFLLRMSDKDPFHPVPLTFRYHLKKWITLFVGYSLLDYNLRLLFKSMRWRIDPSNIPPTYSVDKFPDPLVLDVWSGQRRYVRFLVEDLWAFVPDLYHRVTNQEMPA